MIVVMVRIPIGSEEEGEKILARFRNRAGLVDSQQGFAGFELLKSTGEYISVTRWETQADLDRWMESQAHSQAHAHTRPQTPTSGGHPSGQEGQGGGGGKPGGGAQESSVTVYEVAIPGEAQA